MQHTTDSVKSDTGAKRRDKTQENLVELESLKEIISSIPMVGDAMEVIESLRIFPRAAALPAHYEPEIIRALTDHLGQHPSSGASYRAAIKELRSERRETQRKQKKEDSPSREIYFALFKQILGPLPRDIFSGKCMVKHDGLWEPAQNFLHRVKSEAYDLKAMDIDLQIPAIDSHYFEFECQQERRFIPDVPDWDGVDRIKQIADCIKLDGTQSFPSNAVEQFVKAWCAGIWRKMADPSFQNPVLILKGPQGIGKDVLIDTLSGGFEQWSKDLILSHNDKDNYTQLSRAAVLRIAEFERTSKTDLSTIKDMIFRKFTFLRPSHQPEFRDAQCRASFVASCNTDDIYRDSTGNRRFVVFNVKSIDWDYPRTFEAQKQIMAQARQLAAEKYQPAPMALNAMARFLEEKTPESVEALTVEQWEGSIKQWAEKDLTDAGPILSRGWITNEEAVKYGVFERVTKALGLQLRTVRQHLKSEGLGKNARPTPESKKMRGYVLERLGHDWDTDNDPEEDFTF